MLSRVVKVGVLAALVLLVTAAPAEAFGRRHSTTCQPVYYYPCYCPCYPQHPGHHIGWDCLKNTTDKILRVHVTSGHGSFQAILYPGTSVAFWFIKDGKQRALSAFTLDNIPIQLTLFTVLDQTTLPRPICFPITVQPFPVTKEVERVPHEGPHGLSPSGQPF